MTVQLDEIISSIPGFTEFKQSLTGSNVPAQGWYPYDSIANLFHLDRLLKGSHRDFNFLAQGGRIADIGAADGDMAFVLAKHGFGVDIIDHAMTNFNGLNGARKLRDLLAADVRIFDLDLDSQFELPQEKYGLVIFLGILYHLQNPFYALKKLAKQTRFLIVSTRITRFDASGENDISEIPAAYLLGERESNNDPTDYWIFTRAGLERIFHRTGWLVEEIYQVGDLTASEPADMSHDERCFALLRAL
jgi:2-polyprenyl-3-methyl-5-hydroxy-6-metoxy-1,4-benzoquinol methylase